MIQDAAHLETTEVLQAPQLCGAICRGGGQHLVHRREADSPDTATVAPEHPEQTQVPLPRQRPQFGCAVLGA